MRSANFKKHPTDRLPLEIQNSKSGMALVITLSLIVLVTIAAMAFFARATSNRAIESSRSNAVLAEGVARTGVDYATAQILQEIAAKSTLTNGFYRPTNNTFAVPQRALASAVASNTNLANLVRRSVNETTNGVGETNASAHNTATASRNGRVVGTNRWNAPQLNFSTGFTSTNELPNWIYLNRDGSATATASTNAIGRFAYAAYDVSGLIDINQMGGGDATNLPFKGFPQHADIATAVDGITMNATLLRAWRSGSHTWPEIREQWFKSGGLAAPADGRMFATRQDLLRAMGSGAAGLPSSASPFLTHFTREANAPSLPFIDATTLDFPADHFAAFYSAEQTLTGYHDDGTSYTYKVKAGDPVLHNRFSLGKLGRESAGTYQYWLTPAGPGAGISDAAIKAIFGLKWDASSERWIYTSPDSSSIASEIKTLAQVAAANRPPDFFEILKAGINPNSLGGRQTLNGASQFKTESGPLPEQVRQGNADLHVFRIGASMIDQADNDNYPTRVAFTLAGTDIEAAGVEDLPYLFAGIMQPQYQRWRLSDAELTAAPGGNATVAANNWGWYWKNITMTMTPILFNPHRQPVAAPASAPTSLRAEVQGGRLEDMNSGYRTRILPFLDLNNYPALPFIPLQTGQISVPPTTGNVTLESYRVNPKTIDNKRDGIKWAAEGETANFFELFRLPESSPPGGMAGGAPFLTAKGSGDSASIREIFDDIFNAITVRFSDLRLVLTYRSPSGNYRVYDALGGGGLPGWGVDTGWTLFGFNFNYLATITNSTTSVTTWDSPGTSSAPFPATTVDKNKFRNIVNVGGMLFKPDPRTSRYGIYFTKGDQGNAAVTPTPNSLYNPGAYNGVLVSDRDGEIPLNPNRNDNLDTNLFLIRNMNSALNPDYEQPGPPVNFAGITPVPLNTAYGTAAFNLRPSKLAAGGISAGTGPYLENIADRPQDSPLVFRPNDAFFAGQTSGSNPLISENTSFPGSQGLASNPDSASRPIILQRPFRNVAELGHVFRDQPYKSLNFFHETSADLALLDLFSAGEIRSDEVAGRVNANSAGLPAWKALFRGAGITMSNNSTTFSSSATDAQADALASAALTGNMSISLPGAFKNVIATGNATITANLGTIKSRREALARSMSGMTQTRTWNLFLDVIGQAGKFSGGATGAGDFVVEGEKRCWIHAAIDRFTGKIVDIERESPNE